LNNTELLLINMGQLYGTICMFVARYASHRVLNHSLWSSVCVRTTYSPTTVVSINQSIIYLLMTHQAMKQFEHQDETSRTARHQVHLWLPS